MTALRWPSVVHRPMRARLTLAAVWAAEDKMRRRLEATPKRARLRLRDLCVMAAILVGAPFVALWVIG